MKKIFIIAFISISLLGIGITQIDLEAKATIVGKVVSLNSEVIGSGENITSERAGQLSGAGQPLVFKADGKLYYVINSGGSVDTKSLVENAGKEVSISGVTKSASGVNYIIARSYK